MWDLLILNPMINLLLLIYKLINDFGIAIIIFTALTRLITHPLTVSQMKSTQAISEMQKSKEWLEVQKKYKDDKQKLQVEQARLMQTAGINPAGSCLPLLIQMPIIFGLYQAINAAMAASPVQLLEFARHIYPFFDVSDLIPLKSQFLWMDLGQPERLYILGVGIPILAVLVVVSQYLLGQVMTPPSAGSASDQTAQMSKMMNLYMPFMMGWLTFSVPAGLGIYFVASNLFTFLQYAVMGKLNWDKLFPWLKKK